MTNITPETRIMMMRSTDGRHGYRRQILAALAVSLGPFAAGLSKGYMSPAIASMQDPHHKNASFTVSDQQASWIASLSLLEEYIGRGSLTNGDMIKKGMTEMKADSVGVRKLGSPPYSGGMAWRNW
ncbi:Facilitated trehalose transporter Tret1 [Papilio xuthus]|uniref:Facilitated trehalose transporter Tret1 n=1 Tax=Papilio xuthus TaxID=66420 RepID=A0A194Q5D9_PAPXU|nr:Facilitated trehalose transporter Tret1 [Papilio xuthus]